MDHERFLEIVSASAQIDRDAAERATRATLQTLAERIDEGEARDLAAQLPAELAAWITKKGPGEAFHVDEFLRRVAEREGVDPPTAERHARLVLTALGQAVSPREVEDVAAQLPKDLERLVTRGRWMEVLPADVIVARIAERARLDADAARRATDAVLETLGERIAGGEVEDLAARLPVELRPALLRGNAGTAGRATPMSADVFVEKVAGREGTDGLHARDHARAVLQVLREAVGEDEFLDATAQLPGEYAPLLPGR